MIPPLFDIQLAELVRFAVYILIAYLLALPIGLNREMRSHSAGLRTFPLVAVGACAYMLIGIHALHDANPNSRVMYGIITGIGFVGGGAIIKSNGAVHGTATAASIWNTGAIGVAVAWGRIEIALLLCALNYLTLRYAEPFKRHLDTKQIDGVDKEESGPPDKLND